MAKWQSGKVIGKGNIVGEIIKTFRDLKVWKKGMELCFTIYRATEAMPKAEIFGLTSQMRRAVYSIPLNIAEGFGKHTRPELVRGLRTAMGSLCELTTAYEIALGLKHLKRDPTILNRLAEEDRMIQAFIMALEEKTRQEKATNRLRKPKA